MRDPQIDSLLRKIVEIAAKTVLEYRAEFRTVRYVIDDENIEALAEAICDLHDAEQKRPKLGVL